MTTNHMIFDNLPIENQERDKGWAQFILMKLIPSTNVGFPAGSLSFAVFFNWKLFVSLLKLLMTTNFDVDWLKVIKDDCISDYQGYLYLQLLL